MTSGKCCIHPSRSHYLVFLHHFAKTNPISETILSAYLWQVFLRASFWQKSSAQKSTKDGKVVEMDIASLLSVAQV